MLGGWSQTKDADADVQGVVDSLKNEVQTRTGKTYSTFIATKFQTQVVSGLNYRVKIDIGDGSFLHLQFHRAHTTGNLTLKDVHEGKSENDPLQSQVV